MSVTIQEVAEAAGVSKATVSKVLHKSYSISQETGHQGTGISAESPRTKFCHRRDKNDSFSGRNAAWSGI